MSAAALVGEDTPRRAMVLAAGLGLRMRPITLTTPKPLIPIAGRSMLDRALDALDAHGITEVIVNGHYLADALGRHLAGRDRPKVRLCIESERLETGGGVRNALPLLGVRPFFVLNGDILWQDGPRPALRALAQRWDPKQMDALLLLHPIASALGYEGAGDFHLCDDGRLLRRRDGEHAPFLFAGLQILHPRLLADAPSGAFSLNLIYDRAMAGGRLFGIVNEGRWCHVGTPADIPVAEDFLRGGAGG